MFQCVLYEKIRTGEKKQVILQVQVVTVTYIVVKQGKITTDHKVKYLRGVRQIRGQLTID